MTLNEAWKESYKKYLEVEESTFNEDFNDAFDQLKEAQNAAVKGFETLAEYYSLSEAVDGLPSEEDNRKASQEDNKTDNAVNKNVNDIIQALTQTLQDTRTYVKPTEIPAYSPVAGVQTVERISDMKFPKNIIFFIKQLISWISRVVVYFIEKFKNIIRQLVGAPVKELNPEALKLKLTKAKELEKINMISLDKSGKQNVVSAYALNANDVQQYIALKEGLFDDIFKKSDTVVKEKKPIVITIDLSKDLLSLKQLVQHFYDLYDNAFGSNNEELFKANDLQIILDLFNKTIEGIKTGNISTYEVGSSAVEVSAIDSSRVKENLLRTNTNIDALKAAYLQTAAKIKDITKIITHKEMLMLSDMGANYKWLTASTLQQMITILETVKPRLKDAEKNEKELTKMQKKYEVVVDSLTKMQNAFMALGNITYSTVYQRRIVDLCNSAKYMSQTITLRLTGLGLYIKELKDIRDVIKALAKINDTNK